MVTIIAICCVGGIVVAGSIGLIKYKIQNHKLNADDNHTEEQNFESYSFFNNPYELGQDLLGPSPML